MGENKTHEMTTSTDTRLTVLITDITISEGLYFNLFKKPRFNKVALARTVSKIYQPPTRKLISKYILDVINDQNMESNFILIKKRV